MRLLVAIWPRDVDILVLLPLLKKRNRLDRDDIDQALSNLRTYKVRLQSP